MKLLLVHRLQPLPNDRVTFGAIPYYRMQKPMSVLCRMYPEFDYTTTETIDLLTDEDLRLFDLVLFCREIVNLERTAERLNKLNIPFGLDIDDYWHLDEGHILTGLYEKENVPAYIARSLSIAQFVTCTTEILAEKIKPLNPNVHVIENGIDDQDPVWQPHKIPNERLRFGFTGGNTHFMDLMLIAKEVSKSLYDRNFYHKCQVALCFKAEKNLKGETDPSVYIGYEKILTDTHKTLRFFPDYCRDLKLLLQPNGDDKPYKQIWFRDVNVFGTIYDEIDICVAPLRDNEFNSCKSNIKMLEAGFKDCAVMVSNVSPYTPLATKENSFLLSEKNFFEWQRYILNNPNCLQDKKAKLKEDVQPYRLSELTKKRKELYESCICVQ